MTKALKLIMERSKTLDQDSQEKNETSTEPQQMNIAIFGGLGGRADQAFSQLHHLFKMALERPVKSSGDTYLITADSVIILLDKGLSRIHTPMGPGFFTENVGIIPIGKPALITTRGLEWDVTDWHTEFGLNISTSNHIKNDVIEFDTTERVLFTLEYDARS